MIQASSKPIKNYTNLVPFPFLFDHRFKMEPVKSWICFPKKKKVESVLSLKFRFFNVFHNKVCYNSRL